MPTTNTAILLNALDRFCDHNGGPHPFYVVDIMKGLHRAERKRKRGWRM